MIVERPALERRVLASLEAGRIPVLLGGCGWAARPCCFASQQPARAPSARSTSTSARRRRRRNAAWRRSRPAARAPGRRPPVDRRHRRRARRSTALMAFFDRATAAGRRAGRRSCSTRSSTSGRSRTFPGLRHVLRDLIARLAASPRGSSSHRGSRRARTGCFATRRRDSKSCTCRRSRRRKCRRSPCVRWRAPDGPAHARCSIAALDRRPRRLRASAARGAGVAWARRSDPIAAMAALFAPDGRLTARCRESYEFRLHRARGYGALKAILGILADDEPLNLTEISHHLQPHARIDEGLPVVARGRRPGLDARASATRSTIRWCACTCGCTREPVPPTDADSCAKSARTRKPRCRRLPRGTAARGGCRGAGRRRRVIRHY